MSRIVLGKSGRRSVTLDLDRLLRTRLLIQANSGGGKSWLLRRLAEQLWGRVPVLLVDPEGEFATLREKYGYVLVGKGGETPADPRSAALVAHRLLELRVSAVCDLYEMKPSERHRWVRLFLDALIDAPKKLWRPTIVVVDEAHQFAPEKGHGESETSESMVGLATRGRKRGFAAVFATQRLGKLRKDVAAELLNVLIGQTFIDIDRKRAADALGVPAKEERAFFNQVKILEPGTFWGLGRAIATERILLEVGPVETTHPEPGSARHAAAPPPAPGKVKALLPKLQDLPKEAEQEAQDRASLRAEVSRLKRELVAAKRAQLAAPAPKPVPVSKIEIKTVPVLGKRDQRRLQNLTDLAGQLGQYQDWLRDAVKALDRSLEECRAQVGRLQASVMAARVSEKAASAQERPGLPAPRPVPAPATATGYPPPREAPRKPVGQPGASWDGQRLPPGEKATLTASAQRPDGVYRDQLSVLTGYRRSSRDAYIQRLREKGLVAVEGDRIVATKEGMEALGDGFEPLPQGEALRDYWMRRLPPGEKAVLESLLGAYPNAVHRDRLSEATQYARSSRDAYIQRLKARRLVEDAGRAEVRASESLFS